MSSNFGTLFRISTFGESHCKGVGVVIDGCPPGMALTEEDIQPHLDRRRPGQSSLTSDRAEADRVTIISGTENGRTLGTPILLQVANQDQRDPPAVARRLHLPAEIRNPGLLGGRPVECPRNHRHGGGRGGGPQDSAGPRHRNRRLGEQCRHHRCLED